MPRGSRIGQVVATDADADGPNSQLSYTLISDWANDVFSLNPSTGVFTLTASLDYEQVRILPRHLSIVQGRRFRKRVKWFVEDRSDAWICRFHVRTRNYGMRLLFLKRPFPFRVVQEHWRKTVMPSFSFRTGFDSIFLRKKLLMNSIRFVTIENFESSKKMQKIFETFCDFIFREIRKSRNSRKEWNLCNLEKICIWIYIYLINK